jgi:hypothetical protein
LNLFGRGVFEIRPRAEVEVPRINPKKRMLLFVRMWQGGCPTSSIAKICRFPSSISVSVKRVQMRLPPRDKARWQSRHMGLWTEDDIEIAKYLKEEGVTLDEIGFALKRTWSAVASRLRHHTDDQWRSRFARHLYSRAAERDSLTP